MTTKTKIKTITIDPSYGRDRKKLARYLSVGWTIASDTRRNALQWKPGKVDYILIKTTEDKPKNPATEKNAKTFGAIVGGIVFVLLVGHSCGGTTNATSTEDTHTDTAIVAEVNA